MFQENPAFHGQCRSHDIIQPKQCTIKWKFLTNIAFHFYSLIPPKWVTCCLFQPGDVAINRRSHLRPVRGRCTKSFGDPSNASGSASAKSRNTWRLGKKKHSIHATGISHRINV